MVVPLVQREKPRYAKKTSALRIAARIAPRYVATLGNGPANVWAIPCGSRLANAQFWTHNAVTEVNVNGL